MRCYTQGEMFRLGSSFTAILMCSNVRYALRHVKKLSKRHQDKVGALMGKRTKLSVCIVYPLALSLSRSEEKFAYPISGRAEEKFHDIKTVRLFGMVLEVKCTRKLTHVTSTLHYTDAGRVGNR